MKPHSPANVLFLYSDRDRDSESQFQLIKTANKKHALPELPSALHMCALLFSV